MRFLRFLAVAALLALGLAGCAAPPPPQTGFAYAEKVPALAAAIRATGPGVDPVEAERVAEIAYSYPLELRASYGVTDTPLVHNTKVNLGLRPRGLCYQWADDLEARLRQENFRTVVFHRAIANSDRVFRIEHSTVIVSAVGGVHADGIVLDPWRRGGFLTWVKTPDDPDYHWIPRDEVFRRKAARR